MQHGIGNHYLVVDPHGHLQSFITGHFRERTPDLEFDAGIVIETDQAQGLYAGSLHPFPVDVTQATLQLGQLCPLRFAALLQHDSPQPVDAGEISRIEPQVIWTNTRRQTELQIHHPIFRVDRLRNHATFIVSLVMTPIEEMADHRLRFDHGRRQWLIIRIHKNPCQRLEKAAYRLRRSRSLTHEGDECRRQLRTHGHHAKTVAMPEVKTCMAIRKLFKEFPDAEAAFANIRIVQKHHCTIAELR